MFVNGVVVLWFTSSNIFSGAMCNSTVRQSFAIQGSFYDMYVFSGKRKWVSDDTAALGSQQDIERSAWRIDPSEGFCICWSG